MLRNWSVLICIVLLQLGNVHNAELSGVKGKRSFHRFIHLLPDLSGQPDKKKQGENVLYKCRARTDKSTPTLMFEQRRRGSESWGPVLGDKRLHRYIKQNVFVYANLTFKADFKLHNGSSFRCLVKETPTNPEPVQLDLIVVRDTDHSNLDPAPAPLGPRYKSPPVRSKIHKTTTVTNKTTTDRKITERATTDRATTDRTPTDRTKTDRTPTDRTTTDQTSLILYISSVVTGCILIIIIAEIIMRRCNRPSGEGHVDTPTPQQRVDDTANEMLSIYEELDDDSDSDNVSNKNPVRNTETGLVHSVPIHNAKNFEAGKDITPYVDMETAKGIDTTPYMDMEAGKNIDTTPYMDMEAGKGIDTTPYMDMEAGKDIDTTPYMDMEAVKGTRLEKDVATTMDTESRDSRQDDGSLEGSEFTQKCDI
ncbi:uncharacterized protein LOC141906754 [Tubulanus polymorphus]|uniref:uncharacterized protein LOC141906754 n=1 Tax=Tubulanus polymorphus TaxID=672921 RepID=UPI003DA46AAB